MADQFKPLEPNATTLTKLGSIIAHYEEFTSEGGHEFDLESAKSLLTDPEVVDWFTGMRSLALLPLKRDEDKR